MVRIIAGRFRHRVLAAPPGRATRPMLARARQALFDALGARCADAVVLDLFAGTGALAFEAASRGARRLICCETDAAARRCLHANARALGLEDDTTIRAHSALLVPARPPPLPVCDLIFCAPPYRLYREQAAPLAALLAALLADHAHDDTVLVTESDAPPAPIAGAVCAWQRRYGTPLVSWWQRDRATG